MWTELHLSTALLGAALVALTCFAQLDYSRDGDPGALTSLAALVSLALLLFVHGRRIDSPAFQYGAAGVLSLGSYWVCRYAGLTNPQWYVALPGLNLTASGIYLTRRAARLAAGGDGRAPSDASAFRLMTGAGLALLLGTTALQALDGAAADDIYTAVLVAEGVVALLAGVGLRQRVPVLCGAGAIALAALRALYVILSHIPPFIVFGLVALGLLVLAAVLALLRERLGVARSTVSAGWTDWD